MKKFELHEPATVKEAIAILARHGNKAAPVSIASLCITSRRVMGFDAGIIARYFAQFPGFRKRTPRIAPFAPVHFSVALLTGVVIR